jgi:hypothetical protein
VAAGPVSLVVEGMTDAVVARRLLEETGLEAGPAYVQAGKASLDHRLAGYNSAARYSCWLVLRDLDRDASCAPELRQKLLPASAAHMRFHLAVRAVESWLLADADALGEVLAVRRARISPDPDALDDPKGHLLDLARHSRRRIIREGMLPASGSTARVGPGYAATLIEFATNRWRPVVAAGRSPSLARLRAFLRRVSQGRTPSSGPSRTSA